MAQNEKLRKQLLGSAYVRNERNNGDMTARGERGAERGREKETRDSMGVGVRLGNRPRWPEQRGDLESEEEEGRSGLGRRKGGVVAKRRRGVGVRVDGGGGDGDELGDGGGDVDGDGEELVKGGERESENERDRLKVVKKGKGRGGNYLDEVLAERLQKRRKKGRRKDGILAG